MIYKRRPHRVSPSNRAAVEFSNLDFLVDSLLSEFLPQLTETAARDVTAELSCCLHMYLVKCHICYKMCWHFKM